MLTEPSTGDQALHLRTATVWTVVQRKISYLLRDFAPIKNRDQFGISLTCDGAKLDVWDQLKVRRENKGEDVQESIEAERVLSEVGKRLSLEFWGGVT